MEKVSIIIPVHNGADKLTKTVNALLKQSYQNIEIVLVENFSSDNSLEVCQTLSQSDERVKVLQSFDKGTTYARKKGILNASGEYITFSDQDDSYIDRYSIEKMYQYIKADNSEICQFGFYVTKGLGRKKKMYADYPHKIVQRDTAIKEELKGLFFCFTTAISTNVWNKIYKTDFLKEVAEEMNHTLYIAEDQYLNMLALTHPKFNQISFYDEAYYVWNSEIGRSSLSGSAENLFVENDFTRMLAIDYTQKYGLGDEVMYKIHLDTVYYLKAIICTDIQNNADKEKTLEKIRKYSDLDMVKTAKGYFRQMPTEKHWEELDFIISDYTAEEYYTFCQTQKQNISLKTRLHILYQKIMHAGYQH